MAPPAMAPPAMAQSAMPRPAMRAPAVPPQAVFEQRDEAAPALAAKPNAFADETQRNEISEGAARSRSADSARIERLQGAAVAPSAPAVGSSAHSSFAAVPRQIDSATALRQAAQSGDTQRLKALLGEQIDVDARDSAGRSALMLAVMSGQAQAVDALLAHGADPNAADSSGTTPLAAALAVNKAEIIAALRRAGAH